ncbi:MAG TPA: hypothetical protein PLS10_05240 [Chitinophagales bacterium]|nr:hypothetical protein [Chitinophagales bacterium]
MIFFRSNNNYPDSMHFEYLISNLLIKKTLFFFYENDELSELHTYNDGDVRLFDYKLKFYYHPTFKYKNGVDDTEYFITSYILYGFSKNTVCNIGIVSTHLLDRYDYFGDLNDSIPSLPHQYNYIEYSPLQIIATSSNYKYIYNFSN